MSQTEQRCDHECDHSQFTMLPIRGFGIAVDTSGLSPAPASEKLCRERVDHDVDIYINGNLETSGDGLTPATAVKSYRDAVLALSRYDGCNLYDAHFHFADLVDPKAAYPDMTIRRSHYATFAHVYISGESHTTTHCGACTAQVGSEVTISNVCMTYIQALCSSVQITGKIAFDPSDKKYALISKYGGMIAFEDGAEVFFLPGIYYSCFYINGSSIYNKGNVSFHTTGPVNVENAFIYCRYNSSFHFYSKADFSGCTSVTGKKYHAMGLSCIAASGHILPGTEAGVLQSGSVFM